MKMWLTGMWVAILPLWGMAAVPPLQEILAPKALNRVILKREILTSAGLDEEKYEFFATVLVRAGINFARKVLTDYQKYADVIPFIDQVEILGGPKEVFFKGSIFDYELKSKVRFQDRGERWIHYEIEEGSFAGLQGDLILEDHGEKGTVIHFRGKGANLKWAPSFIMERGAEIVFDYTAKNLRSRIEKLKRAGHTQDKVKYGSKETEEIPKPRSRI